MKGLSSITQFKIEILLPFTGFRKVFGKMFAYIMKIYYKRLISN